MLVEAMSNDNSRNLSSGHHRYQQKPSHRGNHYQQPPNNRGKMNYRGRGRGLDFDKRICKFNYEVNANSGRNNPFYFRKPDKSSQKILPSTRSDKPSQLMRTDELISAQKDNLNSKRVSHSKRCEKVSQSIQGEELIPTQKSDSAKRRISIIDYHFYSCPTILVKIKSIINNRYSSFCLYELSDFTKKTEYRLLIIDFITLPYIQKPI